MVSAEDSTISHGAYVATSRWSARLSDAPRLPIPPPNLDFSRGQPLVIVKYSTSTDYESNQFGNPAFLEALINSGSVTLTHQMLDWKYANRRQAQMILPFLYVGPLSAAKDEKYVRDTGFTLLMSVRSTALGPTGTMDAAKVAAPYGIQSYNLDVDSSTDLIRKFPHAIKAVNDHIEHRVNQTALNTTDTVQPTLSEGKILVFCETGNEKSAAFVAAYLMAVFNIDLVTAFQTVQSQRFSICVDDSIKNALGTFETLLTAKRDVGKANRHPGEFRREENVPPQNHADYIMSTRSKRTLDNLYEDDEVTDIQHDMKHTQDHDRRSGEAPFLDREQ